jgi:hypothetical protein
MTAACVINGISQQNSFNLISDNPEFLVVQHLRCIVARPEVLLFTRKSFINEAGRSQEHVQKDFQECLYINLNPLNAELNHICHLLALLGAHHILHGSRIRVNGVC